MQYDSSEDIGNWIDYRLQTISQLPTIITMVRWKVVIHRISIKCGIGSDFVCRESLVSRLFPDWLQYDCSEVVANWREYTVFGTGFLNAMR